jgi:hypothetical protein
MQTNKRLNSFIIGDEHKIFLDSLSSLDIFITEALSAYNKWTM